MARPWSCIPRQPVVARPTVESVCDSVIHYCHIQYRYIPGRPFIPRFAPFRHQFGSERNLLVDSKLDLGSAGGSLAPLHLRSGRRDPGLVRRLPLKSTSKYELPPHTPLNTLRVASRQLQLRPAARPSSFRNRYPPGMLNSWELGTGG